MAYGLMLGMNTATNAAATTTNRVRIRATYATKNALRACAKCHHTMLAHLGFASETATICKRCSK